MPLILGSNAPTGGDVVDNSLRFENASSDSLQRTMSSSGSSRTTFTISTWFKLPLPGLVTSFFGSGDASAFFRVRLGSTGRLNIEDFDGAAYNIRWDAPTTGPLLRDPSAWYHLVFAIDTTQSTLADRTKIYINSEDISSLFTKSNDTSQNDTFQINNDDPMYIGTEPFQNQYFSGYLSEFVLIDGQQLDPTSFGEFDEDSGIWKPIDVSGLTFGTNGFYLEFKDSSALGDDTSGNSNDFTVNNLTSIDQTTDTPTNNFATLNPLVPNAGTLANGNLDYTGPTPDGTAFSTLGVNSGKYYWEVKLNNTPNKSPVGIIGDADPFQYNTDSGLASPRSYSYYPFNGSVYTNGSTNGDWTDTTTSDDGDIIGVAMDLDNGYVYFSKNGSFMNSGDPTSGASGTGGVSLTTGNSFFALIGDGTGAGSEKALMNFGNAPYTISTGNSDANGYGNFEYAVPSGYYALCTKNLAEYG